MGYFQELPDLLYQSNLLTKTSSQEYLRVKNLFRKVKLTDQVKETATFFQKYKIEEGDRPDTVAEKIYGDSRKDWVVVLTAGITNIRDEWPLSNADLYRYGQSKYGLENLFKPHHYETTEVRDHRGRLIVPAGQIVDKNFTIYDSASAESFVGVNPLSSNVIFGGSSFGTTPNNGTLWSTYLTGTQNPDGYPLRNIFDGDISTIGSSSGDVTFTPPTPIPFEEQIEIYVGTGTNSGSQRYVATINGEQQPDVDLSGSGEWKTIYTGKGGTLDKLLVTGAPGGSFLKYLSAIKIDGYIMRDNNIGPVVAVTNYEYETKKNESKREIDLMRPRYMQQFMNDIRDIMNYKEGPLVINNKLISTENTRLIGP